MTINIGLQMKMEMEIGIGIEPFIRIVQEKTNVSPLWLSVPLTPDRNRGDLLKLFAN